MSSSYCPCKSWCQLVRPYLKKRINSLLRARKQNLKSWCLEEITLLVDTCGEGTEVSERFTWLGIEWMSSLSPPTRWPGPSCYGLSQDENIVLWFLCTETKERFFKSLVLLVLLRDCKTSRINSDMTKCIDVFGSKAPLRNVSSIATLKPEGTARTLPWQMNTVRSICFMETKNYKWTTWQKKKSRCGRRNLWDGSLPGSLE